MESLVRNTDTSGVVVGWGKTANGQSLDALTGAFTSKQQKLEVYLYCIIFVPLVRLKTNIFEQMIKEMSN